ncbi:hypothetical protein AHF37_10208 [Paragonimus kellicotti]|nr:hypothetical protein AHF37_10208 [Paragonimus kellicotti]
MGESTETNQAEKQNAMIEEEKQVPQYRSVVLNTYGGSKHLRVESFDVKQAKENEVEISVEACGVNFLDVMLRQGLIEHLIKPPFVMGSECAGIVTAVGEAVTEYKVVIQSLLLRNKEILLYNGYLYILYRNNIIQMTGCSKPAL